MVRIDHQVIFIHNPRTSGSSISAAMEQFRDSRNGKFCPNRYLVKRLPGLGPSERPGVHFRATQVRENIDPNIWNNRVKFSVVRNPWDRMASLYEKFRVLDINKKHITHSGSTDIEHAIGNVRPVSGAVLSRNERAESLFMAQKLPLEEWILWCRDYQWPIVLRQQIMWFDGLDEVFRFEDMQRIDDFLNAKGYLRICGKTPIIINKHKHRPWRTYYNRESFDYVADFFSDDIRIFGYGDVKFEG